MKAKNKAVPNLKPMPVEELVDLYRAKARERGIAMESGTMRDANRAFDVTRRIMLELRNRDALMALAPLLTHDDAGVRLAAAADLIHVHPAEARRTLTLLSSIRSLIGMSAGATLLAADMAHDSENKE